jgi:predicted DNA binding CopG/RHH family protein
MKERPVQLFNKEYVERCKDLTTDQILQFLEDFRNLHSEVPEKCQLISMKIEPSLLRAFKKKCELMGISYQKQIKILMREWV